MSEPEMEYAVIVLLGIMGLLFGALIGTAYRRNYWAAGEPRRGHGIPDYKDPPPPPPEPERWYPVLAHEVVPGEYYRCRLSGLKVLVKRCAKPPDNGTKFLGSGTMWVPARGVFMDVTVDDNSLETDCKLLAGLLYNAQIDAWLRADDDVVDPR